MLGGSGAIGSRDTDRRFVSSNKTAASLNNIEPRAGDSGGLSPYQQWRQSYYAKKAARDAERVAERAAKERRRQERPKVRTYAQPRFSAPAQKLETRAYDIAKNMSPNYVM
jgi:hypothetical protein